MLVFNAINELYEKFCAFLFVFCFLVEVVLQCGTLRQLEKKCSQFVSFLFIFSFNPFDFKWVNHGYFPAS